MKSRRHRRALIETFESRILYSADPGPVGIVAAVLAGSPQTDGGVAAIQQAGTELVFVDARVPDVQQLLDDISAQQQAGRPIEVVVVGSDEDGIGVIGSTLAGRSDVSAVHVIGHGASGVAQLGASELDAESVFLRAGEIAGWGDALFADADLLLYGCDVGDGDAGQSLVASLAQLTGADVAASDDPTGSALLGGDWDLEVRSGTIEATPFASASLQTEWTGVLALTAQGTETKVNTSVSGTQTENWSTKTVAMDANGNYVVVWMDGSGATDTGIGIYGQRYNASGVAQGAQFHVNTYTADNQSNPTVAMDANGNFVVVWQSNGQDGSSYGVYAQRYNSSGVAQGSEFRVNTYTTVDQLEAAVAMDANGNFVIAWQSYGQDATNTIGIYAQRYNSSGVAQGGEFQVNTYTANDQTEPSVAMDANGNFVIAWQSYGQDGSVDGIYAQRYNSSGVRQGSEFHVSTYTTGTQDLPVVAMDSSGNFVVVWESAQDGSGNGIYGQRYNSSGVAQGGEFQINTTTTNQQQNPVVTMLAGGAFAVTWQSYAQDGSFDGAYMRQYDSSGTALTGETLVNTTTTDFQDVPSLAADEKGHLVVVWHGNGPGDTDGIFMQRYTYAVAPVLTLTGYSGTYVENAGVIYDAGATVTDADTTTFTGGQLIYQITANGTASDELGIRNQGTGAGLIGLSGTNITYGGTTIGTYGGSFGDGSTPLTVTFNSNASVTAVQALVRNITYRNTSDNPTTATRTISLTVSDGTGMTSTPAVVLMAVMAVNDAPVITSAASASVAENTTAVMTVTSSDVDGGTPVYSISGGVDQAKFTINSSTGALAFSAAPDYEAPTDSGGNNVYDVTVQVSDGAGGTATQAIAVTVTDVSGALVVTTTADTNDTGLGSSFTAEQLNASKGTDGRISLREAIIAANTTAGTDTISFNIPDALVSGAHTIKPTTALPTLTGTVIIDGTTEPDYVLGRPVIEIDGSLTGSGVSGLVVGAGAGGSTIRGLAINSFNSSDGYGIYLQVGADNNLVEGNIIGLDVDGTTAVTPKNNYGVYVGSSGNTIGGTTVAARNVLSNNINSGVGLYGSNNVVIGNYIGTDVSGTLDRGNQHDGVYVLGGTGNRIGGTTAAERNILSGNDRQGVELAVASGSVVQGNYIGTDYTGTLSLGNALGGIWVGMSSTNVMIGGTAAGAGNLIANNGAAGVLTDLSGASFSLLGNTYYGNTGLGIDLKNDGVTANDAGDADTGPNSLQNYPVISTARTDGSGHVALVGTLSSAASSYYRIEFYANAAQDASGYGEGQRYLGYVNVATDGAGSASFNTILTATVAAGEYVSAIAIKSNAAYASFTDTSEFSADALVSANQVPVVTTTGSALAYTENAAATVVDGALTLTDADSPNLSGATVRITSGFTAGQDTLAFTDQSGITGSWNVATGVLTLTGSASVASYQTALRSITYVNTSEQPSTSTRTVSFVVSDGLGTSTAATRNVTVASVDDAPSFNAADFTVTTAVGSAADRGYATTVQADGKILVAGYASNGSNLDFLLMRFNVDGTLDTSFGGGDGIVTTPIGSSDEEAHAVSVQADGKILVAGFTTNGAQRDFALVRYLADGTLDTSFGGGDGIVTTDIGSSSADEAWSMVVQTDGRIFLGGTSASDFAVVRYLVDGSLDTSFSSDGKATVDFSGVAGADSGYGLALQADGKLVQTGSSLMGATLDFSLTRYNTDGSLDTGFGTGGKVITAIGSSFDIAQSVVIQSDGKIVVGGYSTNGTNNDFAVVRYTSAGALDTSFGGGDGITTVDFTGHDSSWSTVVQADGKIVMVGGASSSDLAVLRLQSDGSLDTSFSGDGKFTAHLGTNSFLYSAAIGADGRVVATGYNVASTDDVLLVRLSSDGQFDTRSNPGTTSLGGSASYTENGSAVVIDSSVRIFDAELNPADSYAGATLTLARSGGANAQDVFSATGNLGALTQGGSLLLSGVNVGTVTTNASGTLLLTFNASATQVRINEVMSSIAYANSSDAPPASVTLAWTFSDGNSGVQGSGGAKTATGSSTINITAVNDAPVITSSASASVAENTTGVMTVTATDPDSGALSYSIVGGVDAARFSIDSNTGVLTFVAAPDFEAPADVGANNVYNLSVQVSDGTATAVQAIAVTVTDVASTLVVDTTADTNDTGLGSSFNAEQLNASKGADGKISLREAIIAANSTAGANTISFNIAGTGPHTIAVTSALPTLIDAVTIDGTTEPDFAGTPVIELNGTGAGNVSGLVLGAGSSGSTLRGLVINRFAQSGIEVIGGSAGNLIAGNYLGTDVTGLLGYGNTKWGIDLNTGGAGNVIGGNTSALRNVISANGLGGIAIDGGSVTGTLVQGNYIGAGADGVTLIGNYGYGAILFMNNGQGQVGGTGAGEGNLVAGNSAGISYYYTSTDNAILGNRFVSNGSLGIDLGYDGVTVNDASDADTGSNQLQNYPVLTSATSNGSQIVIAGSLNSQASQHYRIEFFASSSANASGYGEGATYLGFTNVVTDASGNASFNATLAGSVANGAVISATATLTNATYTSFIATSEFAADITAVVPNLAPAGTNGIVTATEDTVYTFGTADFGFTDPDGNALQRVWIDSLPAAGSLRLNGSTFAAGVGILASEISAGHLTYQPVANSNTSTSLTFRVQDDGGTANGGSDTDASANTLTINITAVNDAPVITSSASASVAENTTAVLTVTSTDVDGGTPVYALAGGADQARFQINSSTGALSFLTAPDYESPTDVGADNTYNVTVQVSDGAGGITTQAIVVAVTPVNDNTPVISSGATASVAENTTAVMTVIATDADLPGQSLSYSIVGGADAARFSINSTSGALSFQAPPDFEAPTDAGADNIYNVTVQVSDGSLTATRAIAVTVTPVSESAPVITSNGGGASASVSVAENTLIVTSVTATDADLPGDTLTYDIAGGADAASFTIDSSTGVLQFIGAPDYENPTDSGANNVYNLTVRVSDGTYTDTQAIAVTVTNVVSELIVTTASDVADGNTSSIANLIAFKGADGKISLREAIIAANNTAGADTITFAIGSGAQTINLNSALPTITSVIHIEGDSQAGFSGEPVIGLNGAGAGASTIGLLFSGSGAAGSSVKYLAISNFASSGIRIENTSNITVAGNYLGTNLAGTAVAGNQVGVVIYNAANNLVGGSTVASRNVISGNTVDGVQIFGASSTGNVVSGNYIGLDATGNVDLGNANQGVAIFTGATYNTVGGTTAGARNVISGNNGVGVRINESGTNYNTVSGNYIGTNAAGTAAVGNTLQGVQIDAGSGNVIGGTVAGAGNVISGNLDNGILITNGGVNNYVQGNIFGLDASGTTVLANGQEGVEVAGGASGTWIGGTTAATRNLISGNTWQGIGVYGATTTGTVIRGNWIGVAADGTTARGNEKQGVLVIDATNTMIGGSNAGEGNIIANAGGGHQGIAIAGTATGAVMIGNSIYANGSLGIDVGGDWITANDAGDADTGANNLQNTPVLSSALTTGSAITITGTLNSVASTHFRIEFFANPTPDSSGYGEGQSYLGFVDVTTDASGNASFNAVLSAAVPTGQVVTATVTRLTSGMNFIETSEFAADVYTNPPTITSNGGGSTASVSVAENTTAVTIVTATDPDGAAQTLTYSLAGGTDQGKFQINSSTGALSFLAAPNYEVPGAVDSNNVYEVIVQVADGTGATASQTLNVTVTNANDAPVISFVSGSANYPENAGPVLVASFATVTDEDGGNFDTGRLVVQFTANGQPEDRIAIRNQGTGAGQIGVSGSNVTYGGVVIGSWTGGTDGSTPLIVTFNANVTAAVAQALGRNITYENVSDNPSTAVRTMAGYLEDGHGGTSNTASGTLTIIPSNDAPVITSAASVSVAENTTAVLTVTSSDPDGGAPVYSIIGGADAAKFSIDASTGALSFVTAPDYEIPGDAGADNIYNVTVQVSDGALTASQALTVTVTPVSDNTPVITSSATASVAENTTAVLTVTATDADLPAQTLSYAIVGGADAAKFSINASTGALRFVTAPDFEVPTDAGANNIYNVTVQVSDGTLTSTQAIAVTVTPVNDNTPLITSSATANVAENTTAVLTVTATDADLPAQTLSYAIVGGADAAKFTINASTGVLSFITAPDFEVPTDAGADNIYNVTVQVSDGTLASTQAIAVTVTPVNDNTPAITSSATANVAENTTAVLTVTATDADLPAQTLSYAIVGGADAAKFSINASTGALRFVTAPDFEVPTDVGTDNIYNVTVQVSDGTLISTQAIAVTVTPVNDNTPAITSSATASVAENTTAVLTVSVTDADLPAQTLSYSIVGGADAAKFVINASTGALSFITAPDFEAPTDTGANNIYDVTVQVSDGTLTSTQAIAVTVTPANDNTPSITSSATANVAENTTAVLTVTATDADLPAQVLGYSIVGGADAAKFTINASTGALSFVTAPDFEAPTDAGANNIYDVTVQVSDGTLSSTQAIAVTVTPVNDNTPAITSSATANVAENTAAVLIVTASDADLPAQTLSYSIVGGADAAKFSINASTGALSFVMAPDFEAPTDTGANNIYNVTVQVSDGTLTSTQAIAVTVTPVNDNTPAITSSTTASVAENTTAVLTVTATDADLPAQTLSYAIVGGADAAKFTINAATGVLSFVTAPDFEAPTDVGANNIYDVTVQVSDGTLTSTQAIAVTVMPVNDNTPAISSSATASVAENTTAVLTVTATDADLPAQTLSYAIVGGADAVKFSINASTGVLSFVTAPDFEAPTDTGANNIYNVTVQVSDGTLTSTQAIAVTVMPVNDNTPTITSSATANVAENTTAVLTVTATDADLPAQTLSYSIVGGADAAKFTINASTGALSFVTAPDFEAPTDVGANNIYDVTVQVSDGTLSSTQAIAVTVTPVNDNTPTITSSATANVAENTTAVITVAATDADLPAQTLSYSIVGGADAAKFTINASTGVLSFVTAPDFEVPTDAGADNIYNVTVLVSDGTLTSTQAIAVTVTPVNDNTPAITSSATASVAENTTAVLTVTATDADLPAQTLSYAIVGGADGAKFSINASTGALSFVTAPDFEAPTDAGADNIYDVTVQVSDGTLTSTQAIAVTVTPVNDNTPVITSSAAANVAENTTAVLTVTSTDADLPAQTLSYAIVGGADADKFSINASTGALRFVTAPDFEVPTDAGANNIYDVTVQVSDGTLTSTQAIAVTVTPVNDNTPVITSSATANVAENTTAVLTVTATDADLPAQTLSYAIVGGADAAKFSINASTGALSFITAPDFEAPTDTGADNTYDITVQVSDGERSATMALAVTVTNRNEMPAGSDGRITVAEDATHVFALAEFGFADPLDAPANSLAAVQIVTGPARGSLTLDGAAVANGQWIAAADIAAGRLRFAAAADENGADYAALEFRVQDDGGRFDGGVDTEAGTHSLRIDVSPVNDAPVATAEGYSLDEDTPLVVTGPGVLANDTDIDGDPLTARLVSGPAHGSLTLAADGSFIYTPDANWSGADGFIYRASDGSAESAPVAVSLVVRPVNDAPTMVRASLQLIQGGSTVLAANAVSAADVDSAAGDVVFVVDSVSHGHFELLSAPGVAIGQFSYAALAAGRVVFVHESIVDLPAVVLHPSDGMADGAPMAASVGYSGTSVLTPPGGSGNNATPSVVAPAEVVPPATTPTNTVPEVTTPTAPKVTDATKQVASAAPVVIRTDSAVDRGGDAGVVAINPVAGGEGSEPHVRRFSAENSLVKFRGAQVTLSLGAGTEGPLMEFMLGSADNAQAGTGSAGNRQTATEKAKVPPLGDDAYADVRVVLNAVELSGIALSVGAVWWASRAGGLVASLLMAAPAWRTFDPLPVLGPRDEEEGDWGEMMDDEMARDEEGAADVFDEHVTPGVRR